VNGLDGGSAWPVCVAGEFASLAGEERASALLSLGEAESRNPVGVANVVGCAHGIKMLFALIVAHPGDPRPPLCAPAISDCASF